MPDLPYSSSKAGQGREKEIRQCLRDVGADAVGFMVDDAEGLVICQFRLNGRNITVPVSVRAYAMAWQRANPCGPRTTRTDWERKADAQAEIAVWAILADWIKAQVAMMLGGLLDADTAFLPHIHAPDGRRMIEVAKAPSGGLLPPPKEGNANA